MSTLTTRQRDLLQQLLSSNEPLSASQLADEVDLTARQVNYDLKGLKGWLAQHDIPLRVTPGVGSALDCSPAQSKILANELAASSRLQLVLTAEQRQQLLALALLVSEEPFILYQLQQLTQVSRTTILKDLTALSEWVYSQALELKRRTNYGIWIEGDEPNRRHAIASLLWGEAPLGTPLFQVSHACGLEFSLADDAELLPIVKKINKLIKEWDTTAALNQVAYVEAQLGGRFTDDAVLYLSLIFSIQNGRVQHKHPVSLNEQTISWLKSLAVWPVAADIARRLGWRQSSSWPVDEVATIAMHILTAPRNERWPGDLDIDHIFHGTIEELVESISQAYGLPNLSQDSTLKDGLVNHIIPACLRLRFGLWAPASLFPTGLSTKYAFENDLARTLADIVEQRTQLTLPEHEINNIALLLRAAYIRERPNKLQEVLIVCPSGMATAQLLIARLKARFPRLGQFKVVSMRELDRGLASSAELIISTVPLPAKISEWTQVIQVHPLLLPEDVEAITQWLA